MVNVPYNLQRAVTPDDDADLLDGTSDALFVAGDGSAVLAVVDDTGVETTFENVITQLLPIKVRRVLETTTATVVALYIR